MDYFRNIVIVAAIAGALAGLAMTVAQQLTTVPMIVKAEVYEEQGDATATAHEHGAETAAHDHDHGEGWAPADGAERTFFTFAANMVTGVGFALLLVAVSELFGGIANWRQGVFWGLAGFVVFTLAPGLGLPPELPAMPAAELGARQAWWLGTVLATAIALGLLFYSRSLVAVLAAIALLVAPHVIGAPQPVSYESPIPEGLHHSFVVAVVMTALLFWVLLGGLAGFFRERFIHAA
ncbi:cobalt transporter [Methyloceanibacter superfactus]|uniref:Cobalt transporter n=1 Tax=Methyloceanibacter superfactus TaxID=1774969 RepID=A0A1E3W903_9HYPH|nr:CbtA family protein [Methyloceanibacter superfactus]ODS01982.1 cobalt transporter [Methyloceanibacter superfactus]